MPTNRSALPEARSHLHTNIGGIERNSGISATHMSLSLISTLRFITSHPLNDESKVKSIFRFLKWQIGSRMVSGAIVYDWVNGSRFIVKQGETGLTGNIYTGLHEFSDMAYLLHVLRRDDLFIDVGANVGSYTVLACAAVGARGYAFEPVPETYQRLVENVRINHLEDRVKSVNMGIGAGAGIIAFTKDRDTMNHALAPEEQSESRIDIEVTALDIALNGASPTVMKIDVEGYETPVLQGSENTLKQQTLNSVIMELNGSGGRYGYDEAKILELMFDHGFKTYSYDPLERRLFNLHGKNLRSGNTLFIRDEPFVTDRLVSAPKVLVHGKWL